MASALSESRISVDHIPVKLIIAGPFGVGKTTMVSALSEIKPLNTEEVLTQAGTLVDDLTGVNEKTTTTTAIDFGRLTLPGVVLYLFGAPGQTRFQVLWEELARGALGVLVLADTRRIDDSFAVLDLVENAGIRYAVAVNHFPDSPDYPDEALRQALDLDPRTPLLVCDARDPASARASLIALVEHIKELMVS
ncbi:GTP-binding protein [Nonomuraea wenchangensis]|uniref:Signal recognition particle receptor subunit beta, a GTPase n=1 Tax=Nonomuraea wenchangensis TaxID=568860 RepID=A0A1I0CA77_9ACTN|nr:ATP/GTP-binding protein [Nonomuraea wenchangensis]SET15779.1 Signal recognition particle receptor subunit beta, a GTPase [Nonomuraea wenchangensis]